ncbi:hypothetical protein ABK249_11875 [Neorhizobium sp. Rsf11]|uniref:Uncharacterized protein n=1 Tax=Neorhizobium phenanthreniclasticum TaxID=3157917 RepID=A0ABV0M191_9HYPH
MFQFLGDLVTSNVGQALLIAALTALAGNYLRPKGKLVWSVSHQHYYNVPRIGADGAFPVRTQQIWIQNLGRKAIEDIEIVLNWKPQHYEVWDPRHYTPGTLPDGRHSIRFPNLSSQEYFTISILDTFNELPIVLAVRWKEGLGKEIRMGPNQVHPRWVLLGLWLILLVGATAIFFGILQAVLYAIALASTP